MTVTPARPSTTRAPGRPAATPTEAESANLHRIADLAVSVAATLRREGRGKYESERHLMAWLSADGVAFTKSDLGPALTLLVSVGGLSRPETGLGMPRPGWLPTASDAPVELSAAIRTGHLVISVAKRVERLHDNRVTKEQLAEALLAADEEVSDRELDRMLRRLSDCGLLVQRRRFDSEPMSYTTSSQWPMDAVDNLEADIGQVLRARSELGYEDLDQLKVWLSEAGVEGFSDRDLGVAEQYLFHLGHLATPRADTWEGPGPRLTWWIEPRIRTG